MALCARAGGRRRRRQTAPQSVRCRLSCFCCGQPRRGGCEQAGAHQLLGARARENGEKAREIQMKR
eukprot:6204540-Pleurochrysis_carterae.AAC.1